MIKVFSEIIFSLNKDFLVVFIVVGVMFDQFVCVLGYDWKIICVMLNIFVLVNVGMIFVMLNVLVILEDIVDVLNIFCCFGEVEVIVELMIYLVVGVSGFLLVYVFMFIEVMVDVVVLGGMLCVQVYKFVVQVVMGFVKMVLEMGEYLGVLKDMVCLLGGIIIEVVCVLEEKGFCVVVIEVMMKCMEKFEKFSKF